MKTPTLRCAATLRCATAALVLALLLSALILPSAAEAQGLTHIVQPGENLTQIAARYGTTVQAIMSANGLSNPNFVWVGQRLAIPGTGGGASTSGGGSGGVHVVQWGETLYSIARRYGTTAAALAAANGLGNANFIYAGQRLTIPGAGGSGGSSRGGGTAPTSGAVHVVQRGETLYSIARRYGTTAAALATTNGLSNPNVIYVGQRLTITSGGGTSSSSSSASGSTADRWIDVDLSAQRVHAYQGNAVVRTMVVSTGIASYPTPPGRFQIYAKYPSVTMSGPGYYLPGVPHTMFFYRGYALHGTYWHSNFGTPMSHGCINLTKADAAWLYNWASVGTSVVIHW
jgi:LysM repeat protein